MKILINSLDLKFQLISKQEITNLFDIFAS